MNSEQPSLPPIAVPAGVRWREFRFQILPLLAFGAVAVLTGLLWQQAVMPVTVDQPPDPPAAGGQALDTDPPLEAVAPHQVSHHGTNGIAKAPAASE